MSKETMGLATNGQSDCGQCCCCEGVVYMYQDVLCDDDDVDVSVNVSVIVYIDVNDGM
jgi:hypothetical protein